jgi:5'-nucleotidase/UDP-sugar diphosphatase
MSLSSRRLLAVWLLAALPVAAEIRSLTILHTNDLHARFQPLENHHGGFAYLAAEIRQQRKGCADCILLNAGDLVQGTPVSSIFHGLPIYEVANLLGFDAATVGNHEFDYGWPQVKRFIDTAKYPIVSANLVDAKGALFTPKPYVILRVNGLRIAVIGAMTETLNTLTNPASLGDCRTLPLIATLRRYADEVRSQADLIVLLGHIDREEELAVLKQVPEISVLVTGHIHNGLQKQGVADGRILVRVKSYGEELGRLDLQVDTEKKAPVSWKWTKIPIDSTRIEPAPDVADAVKHWEDQVTARVDRPLAVSRRAFTKAQVRDLMERAMRTESGADLAFMNIGGVRDILPEGQLLERHIWDIMPFDDRVVVGTFKGRDLPAVVTRGRTIDPDREYTLAVTDFTAANQQTEENLQTTGLKFPHDVGLLRDMLIDWCRKQKVIGE